MIDADGVVADLVRVLARGAGRSTIEVLQMVHRLAGVDLGLVGALDPVPVRGSRGVEPVSVELDSDPLEFTLTRFRTGDLDGPPPHHHGSPVSSARQPAEGEAAGCRAPTLRCNNRTDARSGPVT